METQMPERSDFWKGVVTGTLVGMAIAIYAKWDLNRLTDEVQDSVPDPSKGDPSGLYQPTAAKPVKQAEVLNFRQAGVAPHV
jgi:hypothetical protein